MWGREKFDKKKGDSEVILDGKYNSLYPMMQAIKDKENTLIQHKHDKFYQQLIAALTFFYLH